MRNLIFSTTETAFPINVVQVGRDRFRVVYGVEVKRGDYAETCATLGQALMHAAACDGKIAE